MEKLITSLLAKKIRFMIIGSYSKLWNKIEKTYPKDIDIWVEPTTNNVKYFKDEYGINLSPNRIGKIVFGTIKVNIFIDVTGLQFTDTLKRAHEKLLSNKCSVKYLCEKDYNQNIKSTNKKWDF